MADKKTFHSAQGDKLHPVNGDDVIVVAQPDTSALEGYRTVSAPMTEVSKAVTDKIKSEGSSGIITTDPRHGLLGEGTPEHPTTPDVEYLTSHWVTGQYANVSQIGSSSSQVLPIIKDSDYAIRVTSNIPVFLAGLNLTLEPQTIDVRSQVASPNGQTILIYLTLSDSTLKIVLSTTARSERFDLTYIGKIVMGGAGISSVTAQSFIRIGNHRLAETAQGSSIPVSSNSPWASAYPSWGGQGTIQPVNAGIDPRQWTGNTTFNTTTQVVRVVQDGQFFIKNLALALANLGTYNQILASGGVNGARGYLNGREIWKGKGTSTNVINQSSILVEGWNTVHMEWGEFQIQGPFLK